MSYYGMPTAPRNNTMIFVVVGLAVAVVFYLMTRKPEEKTQTNTPAPTPSAPASPSAPTTSSPSSPTTSSPSAPTVPAASIAEAVATYENKFVRCNSTGGIFYITAGRKQYVEGTNWSRVNDVGSNELSCDIIDAIPDGGQFIGARPTGNNGSVSCATYVGGHWVGGSDIPGAHPDYLGGRALTDAPTDASGACPMALTNDPKYAFARRITGNNGSVSCNTYCSGGWGRDALKSVWPGVVGAQLAPGASDYANSSDAGSCWCAPSETPWPAS
jgi:hypothetical protein